MQELERALAQTARRLEDRQLAGQEETYVHAHVSASSLDIWIYDDGAMFSAGARSRVFERPDYDSPMDLMRAFINEILDWLPREEGKGT